MECVCVCTDSIKSNFGPCWWETKCRSSIRIKSPYVLWDPALPRWCTAGRACVWWLMAFVFLSSHTHTAYLDVTFSWPTQKGCGQMCQVWTTQWEICCCLRTQTAHCLRVFVTFSPHTGQYWYRQGPAHKGREQISIYLFLGTHILTCRSTKFAIVSS